MRKECCHFNPIWISYPDVKTEDFKVLVCCDCFYWFLCEANQSLSQLIPPDRAETFISCVNIQKQFEVASKFSHYEFFSAKNSDF